MKSPLIVKIPKKLAEPFSEAYCNLYNVPYYGDPSYGNEVIWYGSIWGSALRAVIGLLAIAEGVYVFGYYKDDSPYANRAFLALNKWAYSLNYILYGHIREDNHKMWYRMLKEGWSIEGCTDNKELLVKWSPK